MKIGETLYTNGAVKVVCGGGGYSGMTSIVIDAAGRDFATFLDHDQAVAAADLLAAPVDPAECDSDRSYRFARIQYEAAYEMAGMADATEAAACLASIERGRECGIFHKSDPMEPARNGRIHRYQEIIAAAEAAASAPAEDDADEPIERCRTCGADLDHDDAGYCVRCQAKQDREFEAIRAAAVDPLKCPDCGADIDNDFSFTCGKCGRLAAARS